jgi:hypothetical protein
MRTTATSSGASGSGEWRKAAEARDPAAAAIFTELGLTEAGARAPARIGAVPALLGEPELARAA